MSKEWPEILTPEQVAEYLQVQPEEVLSALSSGEIPGKQILGKWRIRKTQLDEWIDCNESQQVDLKSTKMNDEIEENRFVEEKSNEIVSTEIVDNISEQKPDPEPEKKQSLVLLEPPKRTIAQESESAEKSGKKFAMEGNNDISPSYNNKGTKNRNNLSQSEQYLSRSEKLYQAALAAKEEHNIAQARELFEEAILSGPKSVNIFQAYAAMEEKDKRIDNALKVLERGIKQFPQTGPLYDNYGMLLRRRKDLEGAAKILKRGIEAAPDFAKQLHWALVRVLVDMENDTSFKEAAYHAEKAKELGMPLKDDPHYMKLLFSNEPTLGRQTFNFFKMAGFNLKMKKFIPNDFAEIWINTAHIEYTESYDLKGWLLVRCFFKGIKGKKAIDEMLNFLKKSHKNNNDFNTDIAFLIVDDLTPWRDLLYRIIEDGREAIVPIDQNSLAHINSDSENTTVIFRQVLDQWLSRRDLFQNQFPVSGRKFFGREMELQNIMSNLDEGKHTGIYGLRKVGKTSLLYQLQEKRPQDLVVYIDLQEIPIKDCAYLYWVIARRLYELIEKKIDGTNDVNNLGLKLGSKSSYNKLDKPEKRNIVYFAEDIDRLLILLNNNETMATSKIIITIDELEYMLPIPGYNEGFNGYTDFFAHLRGLSQRTQGRIVSVVTAANPLVSEQSTWQGRDNPVFQFYKDTFLPPLTHHECYEMLEKLGQGMAVSFTPESFDAIYQETGGHPYITRQFCSYIVKKNDFRPLEISPKLVQDNLEYFVRDKRAIFREILDRLENNFPQELALLNFIAEGLTEESELATLIDVPIDEALGHLIGYQVVDYRNGHYSIKINLLHRWLQRYYLREVKN